MATKKTVNENNGEKLVRIKLEKTRENKAPLFVSVNERTWLIERGVEVEVPKCVADQIEHHNKMMDEAIAFEEGLMG